MSLAAPIVGILIAIFAVIDVISIALSVVAVFKLHPFSSAAEALIASLCNVVPLGISFFTLLTITLPTGICVCMKKTRSLKCCNCSCCTCTCTTVCTFYTSVLVSASIAIIGTVVAGILQIFSVVNYEEVLSNSEASTLGRAAAALNFTAAVFGAIIIIATTIAAWLLYDENEDDWGCCSGLGLISLIFIAILTIASLVAALLTIFSGFFVTNYSEEGGNSESYEMATIATIFSGGAAGCLLLGFCIGGGVICCFKETIRYVLIIWGNLILGTVVAGGLMIRVGQRFSSGEEVLATDVPLNRGSIATMAYLIGGLNFVTLFIALFPCLMGIGLCVWLCRKNKD